MLTNLGQSLKSGRRPNLRMNFSALETVGKYVEMKNIRTAYPAQFEIPMANLQEVSGGGDWWQRHYNEGACTSKVANTRVVCHRGICVPGVSTREEARCERQYMRLNNHGESHEAEMYQLHERDESVAKPQTEKADKTKFVGYIYIVLDICL